MWQGFLPTALIELQHEYYQFLGHKRTGSWWGTQLVGKMVRATHALWLHRNHLLHMKTDNGLAGLDMIQLREAVQAQLTQGREGMDEDDWSLLDVHVDDIMTDSVDCIRGWLCNVLIARGDIAAAQEESTKDRNHTCVASHHVTPQQQREFTDWRNVCLS